MRLALKAVIQNDRDFVDLILIYRKGHTKHTRYATIKEWKQKNMNECDKRKSHIRSKLYMIQIFVIFVIPIIVMLTISVI